MGDRKEEKKKLINEKIVGRKWTPERVLKTIVLALVCGLLFGLAAAGTFIAVMRYQSSRTEVTESTAADIPESDASASEMPETEETPESTEESIAPSEADETETLADETESIGESSWTEETQKEMT